MTFFQYFTFDHVFLCRLFGILGFLFYVTGFYLLCSGRLNSLRPTYFVIILSASFCVMVSLSVDFNLGSALIQSFYFVMALITVTRRWRSWHINEPLLLTPSQRVMADRQISPDASLADA